MLGSIRRREVVRPLLEVRAIDASLVDLIGIEPSSCLRPDERGLFRGTQGVGGRADPHL